MNRIALLLVLLVSLEAAAQGYYLCQDPKTGKKTAQDFPCQSSKEIGSYAPVSPAELKAREEASRKSKREFERQHPGTYRPEEYMTDEELAAYNADRKTREAERRKLEDELAVREAARRAEHAEQRAAEAERTAQEAKAKAAAAEEAAARQPPIIVVPPRRVPQPLLEPFPRPLGQPQGEKLPQRETKPSTGKRPCTDKDGDKRCP